MGGCSKLLADWAYIKIVLGSNIISFWVAGMHFRVTGDGKIPVQQQGETGNRNVSSVI